jgi:ketosteroid isomerase-like protein
MASERPTPPPTRDELVASTLADWVAMWNSYDLDQVARLFVADDSVTYFSSETPGAIQGFDRLVAHHRVFGFVPGGKSSPNRLWLEDQLTRWRGDVATVFATWYFRRGDSDTAQRGPVTFIIVPAGDAYRIAHAHFANY